jgi:hypothetical protein
MTTDFRTGVMAFLPDKKLLGKELGVRSGAYSYTRRVTVVANLRMCVMGALLRKEASYNRPPPLIGEVSGDFDTGSRWVSQHHALKLDQTYFPVQR